MKKIVSANYRDRSSPNKWLIRDENQDPRQAVEAKSVNATGVRFVPSSSYEDGFGCTMVAKCDNAIGSIDDTMLTPGDGAVRLRFTMWGGYFFEADNEDSVVKKCASLTLQPNGSMFAILKRAKAAPQKDERQTVAA